MSEEERIIEQAKFRATKLVKEYGVSLTFSGYDKVVAEIINSINWYKDFVKESDYSFARSQAIEFNEYLRSDDCDYWYDRDDKVYRGRYANIMATTKEMYNLFLTHQAKQSNTDTK